MTPERRDKMRQIADRLRRIRRACQSHDEPDTLGQIIVLTEVLEELLGLMMEAE